MNLSSRQLASGGALAVTCLRILFPQGILVGARRRWISDLFLAFHRIHVARHALDRGKGALTLVIQSAMPVPVLPVKPWGRYKAATAEDMRSRRNV